jgi:hypothetical protein
VDEDLREADASAESYGFKQITPDNLAQPDPLVLNMWTREGAEFRPMTPEDFITPILALSLCDPVPLEVRRAFVFARNTMCYGYWYWPAMTLGAQQILRVADYATDVAGRLNGINARQTFGPRITQLAKVGIIDASRRDAWETLLKLRNMVTHPDWQQTWGLPQTVDAAALAAREIQALRWITPS